MKKKRSWLVAGGGFIVAIGFVLLFPERSEGSELIRQEGVFTQNYSDGAVKITVTKKEDGSLNAQASSPNGSGGFSKLSIVPGKWAVEFQRPFQLWIFDGKSFHLCEKTDKGYKGTSSSIVPAIIDRAPPKLKKFADRHTDSKGKKE